MRTPAEQRGYWTRVAGTKAFSHPFRLGFFAPHVPRDARVLDLGCGYGRVTAEVWRHGWRRVVGADTAEGMIAVGRRRFPHLDLCTIEPGALPWADGGFGAVVLFSVLTCVPDDGEEEALVAEVARVLAPGGVIYLSDLLLQEDARNDERYRLGQERFGARGVFELPEGVVLRHFAPERIDGLVRSFERIALERLDVVTMNGHRARGFQLLGRKRDGSGHNKTEKRACRTFASSASPVI